MNYGFQKTASKHSTTTHWPLWPLQNINYKQLNQNTSWHIKEYVLDSIWLQSDVYFLQGTGDLQFLSALDLCDQNS